MNKYGTVFAPVVVAAAGGSQTGTIQVGQFSADQRWDVDEIDINVDVLTNGYLRLGYGPLANAPMIAQWDGVSTSPIRTKNLGVDNINQGPVNLYYAADTVQAHGQVGAHMVQQTQRKWIETTASASFSARKNFGLNNFNNAMILTGGNSGAGDQNDTWSSTDGITWTQISSTPFTARSGHVSLVLGTTLFVIGGVSTATPLNDVWSSPDGVTWTEIQPNAAFSARSFASGAVLNGVMYLYGGNNGSANLNDVWSSTDGITWTEVTAAAGWSIREYAKGFQWNNKLWIAGGVNSTSYYNDVWMSRDGAKWVQVTTGLPFTARAAFAVHVQNQNRNLYAIGGYENALGYLDDVWLSPDGGFWYVENTATDFSKRAYFGSVIYNGSMWVVGGYDGSNPLNDVWRSNVALI